MEKNETYFIDLIIRNLSNETTVQEEQVLRDWIASDPENRKLFSEYRSTWELIEQDKIISRVDVDEEWGKLSARIRDGRQPAISSLRVLKSNGNQAVTRFLSFRSIARIAAVVLLIAVPTFFLLRYLSSPKEILVTAENQVMEIKLPDGTSVSLNSGSTLEYPEKFAASSREIRLKGEAYFDVKHIPGSKFKILSGKVRIEDIGTAFYVNTHKKEGQLEVVLTEGKASVYFQDSPEEQVFLVPGEKADVNPEKHIIERTANADVNFMAWKTKKMVFSGNTLEEVVNLLRRVYHADIRLSGENVKNCRLTAIFDNQSLESVLNVIKSTLDVSVISKGSSIEISGNSCD